MRKHVQQLLLISAFLLALTACGKKNAPAASSVPEDHAPASSAETPERPDALSKTDARRLLAEDIDTEKYLILDSNTKLEAEGDNYYVFIVANRSDSKPVGQVALNVQTGDKFNYEGEGVLTNYTEFSLFNPETDNVYSWDGVFSDGESTLELLPMDNTSFEYTINELTGVARITGNTAKDEQNDVTMTFDEDGKLVLTGTVEGLFALQDAENAAQE